MQQHTSYINWSGGKDSALCLYKALQSKQYNIRCLLTSVNAAHNRISMHGVRRQLLEAQSAALNIPLQTIELPEQPGMAQYEEAMQQKVAELNLAGCTHALFGDIFLEDLKLYRESKLKAAGIECVFPLWKTDTTALLKEFLSLGFKTIIVCVNEQYLDKSFCGRIIDESFLDDLPVNVDPCGENGEFHTYCFDGPIYSNAIPFTKGETVYRKYAAPKNDDDAGGAEKEYGFYFCDLLA
ncbi:ATP-binding protein [Foetidibacter luteolus]|uniref:Dph6-related ATP pyrophosphatase n=1 Tax=Foetidibacter luteolus TaxID=2608880 RepID=UPI00129A1591|nr:ATP-binding protein [Foetidibacter luteolus]